jgi:signal peptidase I
MGARGVILLVATLVVMGLALFMFDLPRPASDDMAPSIRKGDLLFACRVCGAPARGDVVLFTPPDGKGLVLRRVIALPGDTVEVKNGVMLVNGAPLEHVDPPEAPPFSLAGETRHFAVSVEKNGTHEYRTIRDASVPPPGDRKPVKLGDEYFLAADRRTQTSDSRAYGPVAHAAMRSTVLRILRAGDGDASRPKHLP